MSKLGDREQIADDQPALISDEELAEVRSRKQGYWERNRADEAERSRSRHIERNGELLDLLNTTEAECERLRGAVEKVAAYCEDLGRDPLGTPSKAGQAARQSFLSAARSIHRALAAPPDPKEGT